MVVMGMMVVVAVRGWCAPHDLAPRDLSNVFPCVRSLQVGG
jgi:hypothetical protein